MKNETPIAIWPNGKEDKGATSSPAVKAAGWLFVSTQLPGSSKTGMAAELRSPNPNLQDQMELQSRYIMKQLQDTVAAGGGDISKDVVRIWQWFPSEYPTMQEFADGGTWPRISITPYLDVRNEFIAEPRPASTGMGVRELAIPKTQVGVEILCIPDSDYSERYQSPDVAGPLAGYSPALRRGDWVFLSGDLPVDWKGDYMSPVHMGEHSAVAPEARLNPYYWYGSVIEKQTDFIMANLKKTLEAAGSSLERVVKAEVYIGHPNDYAHMDKAWRRWFPKNPPARSVIPYMGLGCAGSRVEVSLTLLRNDSKITIKHIHADEAVPTFSHEPHATKAGNLLFISQQMAADAQGKLAEGMAVNPDAPWDVSPARAQMRYMLKNVDAICRAGGTSLDNVVKKACFHDDERWYAESLAEWVAHFPGRKPAATTAKIGGPLVVEGANTLLDLTAYAPS